MYREENAAKLRQVLSRHNVEYMFIGKGAAILQGFPDTTQDIDIYPRKDAQNNRSLVAALKELGFEINSRTEKEILKGKDFIQLRGEPFDMDVVFAPDGFDSFEEAKKYQVTIDGYPALSVDGIIRTKRAAGREKDRASLPQLLSFKEYLDERGRRKKT